MIGSSCPKALSFWGCAMSHVSFHSQVTHRTLCPALGSSAEWSSLSLLLFVFSPTRLAEVGCAEKEQPGPCSQQATVVHKQPSCGVPGTCR